MMNAKPSISIFLLAAISLFLIGLACATDDPAENLSARSQTQVRDLMEANPPRRSSEEMIDVLQKLTDVLPPRPPGPGAFKLYNQEAVIPPQCYTKHEAKYNPCYVCHQNYKEGRENRQNDAHLQVAYSFSDPGLTNRWANLFEDRSERVAAISDAEILDWVGQDNFDELSSRLREANFKGYIPELEGLAKGAEAFDDEGFAKDGSGWVAFNYKPMPSTFWPTNGSTDDVMIRLPEAFRLDSKGNPSRDIYKANLAILEATMKGVESIDSWPIDESVVGRDLDGDGALGVAGRVLAQKAYAGSAQDVIPESFLYPRETEFLHTVRYVGVTEDGAIYNPPRMKEVRYMVKKDYVNKLTLGHFYNQELTDKDEGTLPHYPSYGQAGLYNNQGWVVQSFLEGVDGRLRFATYEENMFCMGCHNAVGSTIDKTFAFPRKVDGVRGWQYVDLKGMPDAPSVGETQGEILTYLERVGGGVEFRNNDEMERRWYRADGSVDRAAVEAAPDVYSLITPSRPRALTLNKAYRVIVEDQDFIYGRDATVVPPTNVYSVVDQNTAPVLPPERSFEWDIRLDWSSSDQRVRQAAAQ